MENNTIYTECLEGQKVGLGLGPGKNPAGSLAAKYIASLYNKLIMCYYC